MSLDLSRLGAIHPSQKAAALRKPLKRPRSGSVSDSWRLVGLFVALSVMSFVVLFWLDAWLRA